MPKRRVPSIAPLNPDEPLLIQSLGRRGPSSPLPRLSAEQIARIGRTVRRVPEVVVKVSGGAADAAGVKAHLKYIDRHGKLPVELDTGAVQEGRATAGDISKDWNLDALPASDRGDGRRARAKAVHNIVLSMPAKVPPEKVLAAAKAFARERFALQHRYAMVLHTDTRHPHVHLVVKAEREDGRGRLNIYKATLREWRRDFAGHLRDQGIEANATSAAERGRSASRLRDPILRAQRRAASGNGAGSTFLQAKVRQVDAMLRRKDAAGLSAGSERLASTRRSVVEHWEETARALDAQGEPAIAARVRAFAQSFEPVPTDAQRLAGALVRHHTRQRDARSGPAEPRHGDAYGDGRGKA
jgi:hypothetical protein